MIAKWEITKAGRKEKRKNVHISESFKTSDTRLSVHISCFHICKEMQWLPDILQLFTVVVFIVHNTDTLQNLPFLMEFPSMLQLNYVTDNFCVLFYFNDWEF